MAYTIKRLTNNTNGHPRYAVHFFAFLTETERYSDESLESRYALALKRSREIGGRKYHNRQFGGGIAFVSFSLDDTVRDIEEIVGQKIDYRIQY